MKESWVRGSLLTKWENWIFTRSDEAEPYSMYKNELRVDQKPNCERSNYKTLRRNIGGNPHAIGIGNYFSFLQLSRQFINMILRENLMVRCKSDKPWQHSNTSIVPKSNNLLILASMAHLSQSSVVISWGSPHTICFLLIVLWNLVFYCCFCSQPCQLTKYYFLKMHVSFLPKAQN